MRRVLRGVLEDAGMQVVGEAGDGLEGVAQAEAVRPDVVCVPHRRVAGGLAFVKAM
jgi:chemotaxis response regulator CheB